MMYSDEELLEGFKNADSKIIESVYSDWFSDVKANILNYGGNVEDAKDIFQEAIIVIYQNYLNRKDFKLTSSLKAFHFSICKKMFMNKNIEKKRARGVTKMLKQEYSSKKTITDTLIEAEKSKRFSFWLNQLDEKCLKVLRLSLDEKSLTEIADKMGYTYGMAKKKKAICKKRLIELLKSDDFFK